MDVDDFDDKISPEAQPIQGNESSAPSGDGATDGKPNNNNNSAGEDTTQNPRALIAQGSNDVLSSNIDSQNLSGENCSTNPRALIAQGSEGGSSGPETDTVLMQQ